MSSNLLSVLHMNTRSDDVFKEFSYKSKDGEQEVLFKRRTRLDLSVVQQLPTYHYIIERYLTLLAEKKRNLPHKHDVVLTELTNEIRDIWIWMNIPPKQHKWVLKKIGDLVKLYTKLANTTQAKRKLSWVQEMDSIVFKLNHGFDIRAEDSNTIQACVDEYEVEPGEEEENLYVDNCSGDCPRIRWCGGEDKAWLKKAQKRKAKLEAQKEHRKSTERSNVSSMREKERRRLQCVIIQVMNS